MLNQVNQTATGSKQTLQTKEQTGSHDDPRHSMGSTVEPIGPSSDKSESWLKSNYFDVVETFDDESLGIPMPLLRGIYGYGFERPSAIQQRAIKPLLEGHDVLAQAHSGSGKTGTFAIGSLGRIDPKDKRPQVLILSPTRELARQTRDVILGLSDYMEVESYLAVGGTNRREMVAELKRGKQIVIGTPGRILDLLSTGALQTNGLRVVVVDEADEMLGAGFASQLQEVFRYMPESVQVALFSATMPNEVVELTKMILRDPKRILVKREDLTLHGISQFFVDCGEDHFKVQVLEDLYQTLSVTQSVIFCNSRSKAVWLAEQLNSRDYTVSVMHGELSSDERALVMKQFKSGSARVLVSTDLLARGIDVASVSLIINYDLPRDNENYLHRIGRSGRFGKKGLAINLVCAYDAGRQREIEQFYATEIQPLPKQLDGFF